MAILKRSVFIVVGQEIIYWRTPGPSPKPVSCMSWCLPDLIKDSSKHIIANYKRGGPIPEDHEVRILWEDAWLKEAIRTHDSPDAGRQVPAPANLRAHAGPEGPAPANLRAHACPEGPAPANLRAHACPEGPAPADLRVKRERQIFARTLSSATRREPISLDTPSPSPSPKKARVGEASTAIPCPENPDFPGYHADSDIEVHMPEVGEAPDELELALEELIDNMPPDEMDIDTDAP